MSEVHHSHPAIVARLKRAEGHIRSVLKMFEDGRSCLDLAQQLHAVEAAVGAAKRELIHDHIEHCLEEGGGADLKEIKQLTKYL
jgi:DNA-binding FrmR family transcriptional regulator